MIKIELDYTEWKTQVDSKSLKHFSYTSDGTYVLIAIDGPLYLHCVLETDDVTDYEEDYLPSANAKIGQDVTLAPFADKNHHDYDGQGAVYDVVLDEDTNLDFAVGKEYDFSGLEIINAALGDIVDLQIVDNAAGTFSGFAGAVLNQFGTNYNVKKDYYLKELAYSARLYPTMIIRIKYNPNFTGKLYVNYALHEILNE